MRPAAGFGRLKSVVNHSGQVIGSPIEDRAQNVDPPGGQLIETGLDDLPLETTLLDDDDQAVSPGSHQKGNRMALENIRERLMLFFDLEARLETDASEGRYRVTIRLPYRRRG